MKNLAQHVQTILIGGIPAIGKSTLARSLARDFEFDYLSVDTIRRVARAVTHPKDYPAMHYYLEQDPDTWFLTHSFEDFIAADQKESQEVWPLIPHLVDDYPAVAGYGMIFEGVNIEPSQTVVDFLAEHTTARYLLFYAKNRETIEKNIMTRGLWATSQEAKAKEIEFNWQKNLYLQKRAQELDMTTIAVEPYTSLARRVMSNLGIV